MQSSADNHGSGLDASRQAAPVIPSNTNDQAALPGKPEGDSLQRRLKRRSALERRRKIAEYLFSDDARKQYIAMKALESATAITGRSMRVFRRFAVQLPIWRLSKLHRGFSARKRRQARF